MLTKLFSLFTLHNLYLHFKISFLYARFFKYSVFLNVCYKNIQILRILALKTYSKKAYFKNHKYQTYIILSNTKELVNKSLIESKEVLRDFTNSHIKHNKTNEILSITQIDSKVKQQASNIQKFTQKSFYIAFNKNLAIALATQALNLRVYFKD